MGVRNQGGKVCSQIRTREKCCRKEQHTKTSYPREPEDAAALQEKFLGMRGDHKLHGS